MDDDLPICELLELAFADEGWDVQICTRGQVALDLMQRWEADVMPLDLRMPELGAVVFLASYRRQAEQVIPVRSLSASSDPDHHGARLGVNAVVAKPFDVNTLCMTYDRSWLRIRWAMPSVGGHDGR